ncbi:ABC transporter permease [Kangiella shandongensis]|uniref:ABC transporter permease n=1 Tax=Kangiella shandongensis TaxID=2763258 RepID=UPI001CBAEB6D|nr:ABC transporter permease [Kangiella shandongensis]
MLKLVYRQLACGKANTVITVLALAAAIAVIIILKGFEQGQYLQLKNIVLNRGSDLVAVQKEVKNFIATRSVIPQLVRQKVDSAPGVKATHPITTLPIIYNKQGRQTPVYLIVFDSSGGPSNLLSGRVESEGNGIVLDQALAKKYALKLGDPFIVSDFQFVITGITREAAFMMPFAFITYDGVLDLFLESEIAPDLSVFPLLSFILIDVTDDKSIKSVRQALEQKVPEIDVFSSEQLALNDQELGKDFFGPIIGVLVFVGFILMLMVIGLLMYANMARNQRNFSVLKALGFREKALVSYTVYYVVLLLLFAFPLSLCLALIISSIIESIAPVYLFVVFDLLMLLKVSSLTLLFASIGSIIPFLILRKCDPVIALQSANT